MSGPHRHHCLELVLVSRLRNFTYCSHSDIKRPGNEYSAAEAAVVEVGPEFSSRLMCFHIKFQGLKPIFGSLMNLSWTRFLTQPLRETETIRGFSYPKERDRGHVLPAYSTDVESFNCDTNKNNLQFSFPKSFCF